VSHVVLLGDSIFDNERYVPGGPAVIDQLRRCLPDGWRATLLARDGAVATDVSRQLAHLPNDATHLIVSAGGNDALEQSIVLLQEPAESYSEVLAGLADMHEQFRRQYRDMLQVVLSHGKPAAVCTVYDAIPELGRVEATGLCLFNDVILREAFQAGIPVIDLRLVCVDAGDYSTVSAIEPSTVGGGKIARAICRLVMDGDFQSGSKVVT
jgi:hypothetical protein